MEARELTREDRELIEHAQAIVDANSDGPRGVHTVGAAVRDARDGIFGGINLFHFTGGPCAELVAVANARASGARDLVTVVAVGNEGRGPIPPCGRDRQILRDYFPDIRVILPTSRGLGTVSVAALLPEAARWERADEHDAAHR